MKVLKVGENGFSVHFTPCFPLRLESQMTSDIQAILQLLQRQTTAGPPAYSTVTSSPEYQRPAIRVQPVSAIQTDLSLAPAPPPPQPQVEFPPPQDQTRKRGEESTLCFKSAEMIKTTGLCCSCSVLQLFQLYLVHNKWQKIGCPSSRTQSQSAVLLPGAFYPSGSAVGRWKHWKSQRTWLSPGGS